MKKISDILGRTYKGIGRIMRLRTVWAEIAGDVLGGHTEPVQISGKTLWVLCDSPAWVQQVNLLSSTLVPRIQKVAKINVDKVAAKFAMKAEHVKKVRRQVTPVRMDIDPADVEKISSPELKAAVKKLLEG